MFTQRCFIRKNTKELVEKLKELGYNPGFSARNNYGNSLQTCCHKSYGSVYGYEDMIDNNSDDPDGSINCGTNEELFLAIAALRDDSDIHQWFIHQDCSFLKCECDSKIDMWGDFEYPEIYPRKATVEELIKHFTV